MWTGLSRYWHIVLPLWLILSSLALWVIHTYVEPSYEAVSLVRIDPGLLLFNDPGNPQSSSNTFLATQVNLISSGTVLKTALNDAEVQRLPMVQDSEDAVNDVRKALDVRVRPGTFLVDVALQASSPDEAEKIVNAVVEAFIAFHQENNEQISLRNIRNLETYRKTLEEQTKLVERQLEEMVDGAEGPLDPQAFRGIGRKKGETKQESSGEDELIPVNYEEYHSVLMRYLEADIALRQAEENLEFQRKRYEQLRATTGEGDPSLAQWRLEQRVEQAISEDREITESYSRVRTAQAAYEGAKRLARNPTNDPGVIHAYQRLNAEMERHKSLHDAKTRTLRVTLARSQTEQDPLEKKLLEAESRIDEARAAKSACEEQMTRLDLLTQKAASSAIRIELKRRELNVLGEMAGAIDRQIQQLTFERDASSEHRVTAIDRAKASPVTDKRMRYMAVAPLGVLGVLLMGVVLLEVRSGRVTHPDDLSGKLRTTIYSVPPLPLTRTSARDDQHRLEQLEEFAQRMDHLRVALCGPSTHGVGRCVMITSAIGGEGKTTLAAQLAGRCANAGLSTLLMDCDLRRPMLARLLEVPEQPGLAEVLSRQVEPEAALIVIDSAGGFHLLPAGAPGSDPGRLFSGSAFPQLLQRFRQAFDVVIVDTPPVLPVPDALQLGRWVDGAILAARRDNSRSRLVERANHLLTSVGISLLGVVVNGVRGGESSYGGYGAYSYRTAGYRITPPSSES
jgi:capsular exopolysaccharide synthesis family protein